MSDTSRRRSIVEKPATKLATTAHATSQAEHASLSSNLQLITFDIWDLNFW